MTSAPENAHASEKTLMGRRKLLRTSRIRRVEVLRRHLETLGQSRVTTSEEAPRSQDRIDVQFSPSRMTPA
jgi:hypothetical protein